jgi:hypothetical protein
MTTSTCPREDDVLVAVGTGRWPDRADADLCAHVKQCAVCSDLLTVTRAFAARDEGRDQRILPDASLVWWRSHLRAREEAARLAVRPITVAQAVSFASVVGMLGVIVGATSSWLQAGLRWGAGLFARFELPEVNVPAALSVAATDHVWLIAVAGTFVLLVPVGLYLATREPRT